MALPQKHSAITYDDYSKLGEDIQYEIIDGQIYNMSPSPNVKRQLVETELLTEFNLRLRDISCRVLAGIDVRLSAEEDMLKTNEWVKPDIIIVCDKNKMHENRIVGAPDLIVEILSKSTAKIDKVIKFNRYQKAGVKEYWIVDPVQGIIDVYVLEDERYKYNGAYAEGDIIELSLFDDLLINLKHVFHPSR